MRVILPIFQLAAQHSHNVAKLLKGRSQIVTNSSANFYGVNKHSIGPTGQHQDPPGSTWTNRDPPDALAEPS